MKAKDLEAGHVFTIDAMVEVIAVETVGKQVKLKVSLIDTPRLEFMDSGFVLELLCKPSRNFHVWRDYDDGDDDDEPEPVTPPTPSELVGEAAMTDVSKDERETTWDDVKPGSPERQSLTPM